MPQSCKGAVVRTWQVVAIGMKISGETHHAFETLEMIYGAQCADEGSLHRLAAGGTCPIEGGSAAHRMGRTREGRVTYVDVTLLTDVAVGGGRFGAWELDEPE